MKRFEQIVAIFIAAGLSIPSYWFFWTLAGGGGYEKRTTPTKINIQRNNLQSTSDLNKP